ncbi:MAG TPA: NUDIX domain-containing protein [archaeon]|nr:NUDIX domain-containing protein [archaeon]
MSEEMVDIVNEKDEVVGKATRKEAHEKWLLHRVVHVVVENGAGKILCLKRAKNLQKRPGYFSNCAGHVDSQETYEKAAERELREELGIKSKITFAGKIIHNDENHNQMVAIFKTKFDGAIKIDKSETESAEFVDLKKIKHGIGAGEKYSPTFIKVIEKLYG